MLYVFLMLAFIIVMGLIYRHFTKDMLEDYRYMKTQTEESDKSEDKVETYDAYRGAVNSLPKNVIKK